MNIVTKGFYFILSIFIFTLIYYHICKDCEFIYTVSTNKKTKKKNLFEMFFFSAVTQSTLGYGDIVPIGVRSRTLVIIQILISFIICIN